MHLTVNDLTSQGAGTTVDLPAGTAACNWARVWGDFMAFNCPSGIRVYNVMTGAPVGSIPAAFGGEKQLVDIGDGYVIVGTWTGAGYDDSVRTFTNTALDELMDCGDKVTQDGVGHVACASSTELIWRDLSSVSTSAGRVLGWLAPATFSSTWTPEIDVTKAYTAGVLRIEQGSTVVRELAVPASADGSMRGVTWDGTNAAGVRAPTGTYTAELVVAGKDGSGAVKAADGVSAPSFQVTRVGTGAFVAVTPSRLSDTRGASGLEWGLTWFGSLDVKVTGVGGVPSSGVSAVILNVTAVTPKGSGYLTVFPTGDAVPSTSNLNFTAGQVVPNLVVAKVGAGGKVTVRNASQGMTNVVVDVAGYFVDGTVSDPGGLTAVAPSRLLDTRSSSGAVSPYGSVKVQATGRGGVPASGVSAVVVNLTAVAPTASGFLTAYPTGGAVPNSSNVNFLAGQVVPNLAFVKLGADGSFTVRNGSPGATQVVADVAGYVMDGTVSGPGMFVPVSPSRVLDTRNGTAVGAYATRSLTVAGAGGVPASGVSGVVMNVTVVAGAGAGYLTVYSADVPAPLTSNLNFTPGQVVPNLVAVKTSAAGAVNIFNGSPSATQVIADVSGYFTA